MIWKIDLDDPLCFWQGIREISCLVGINPTCCLHSVSPFSLTGQVIVGLQKKLKLVAKRLKIAVYIGLRRGQNSLRISSKVSVAQSSPLDWRALSRPPLVFLGHSDCVIHPLRLSSVAEVEGFPPAVKSQQGIETSTINPSQPFGRRPAL